jgi:hypothetical protein
VSAAAVWLQDVRRLFAACRTRRRLVRNVLGTVVVDDLHRNRNPGWSSHGAPTVEPSGSGAVPELRRNRADPRQGSRLAWSLWLLVVLVQGLLVAFVLGNDAMSGRQWAGALLTWVPFLAFLTVGALILARRPGNRIGWLCWAIGFAFTLSNLSSQHLWEALTADGDWSAAWALAAQLGTLAYLGTLLGLLPFLILLFPTGQLLSPRWRPVAWTLGWSSAST